LLFVVVADGMALCAITPTLDADSAILLATEPCNLTILVHPSAAAKHTHPSGKSDHRLRALSALSGREEPTPALPAG